MTSGALKFIVVQAAPATVGYTPDTAFSKRRRYCP
jgi:hypothetical protein